MKKTLWLAGLAVLVTLIYGTVYLTAQQVLRQDANDPQIQLAEDTAAALGRNGSTQIITGVTQVDMAKSLAPFLIVYDNDRQLVVSQAIIDGSNPVLPPGVLMNTTTAKENRLTWQPRGGVRIAAVVVKYDKGYVLAGRSLREVEKREQLALDEVILGWLVTILFIMTWAWLTPLGRQHHG